MSNLHLLFEQRFNQNKDIQRTYSHFDPPFSIKKRKNSLKKEFIDSNYVKNHHFYPLIEYQKEKLKYKYVGGIRKKEDPSSRTITYASHYDACLLSWYAFILQDYYKKFITNKGFAEVSIAYRKVLIVDPLSGVNRGASNIDLANSVFEFVKNKGECVALAFDIKGFFDNLDWKILKLKRQTIMNTERLPLDHYHIFKSLTGFLSIDKNVVLETLGIGKNEKYRAKKYGYLPGDERRLTIRNQFMRDNKLNGNKKKHTGIPQGSAISAVLSNIYMIDFDEEIFNLAESQSALYRRYCDDILIVCSLEDKELFLNKINSLIEDKLNLSIQTEKIDRTLFLLDKNKNLKGYYDMKDERNIERNGKGGGLCEYKRKNNIHCLTEGCDFDKRCRTIEKKLQYLGFLFDGGDLEVRSGSMGRYCDKILKSIVHNIRFLRKKKLSKQIIKRTINEKYGANSKKLNFIKYLDKGYKLTQSKRLLGQKKKSQIHLQNLLIKYL